MRVDEDRDRLPEPGQARAAGAWYSSKARVHHNHPRCVSGRLIGGRNRRAGDGGKPLCEQCQALNQYG
jgi:hypothetical protein